MEETARRAADLGVAVGAHPSYPDREGFGRREVGMRIGDITGSFTAQIETIVRCAARAGTAVAYVKPHGALYNRAMDDRELAESLTSAVAAIGRELAILSLPGSELEAAAQRDGLRSAREGFIDRAYESSGRLVPRSNPGAVLQEIDAAAGRAAAMALAESIAAIDGGTLRLELDSLCVHSDSARALDMVTLARRRLEEAGFTIASFAGRR